jgi:uncharacterized protein
MSTQPLDDKLDRFRRLLVGHPTSSLEATRHPARYARLANALGSELVESQAGAFCLKRTLFSPDYFHGTVSLAESLAEPWLPASAFSALEESGEVHVDELIYIDTETTGLGGAGIVPFLVGVGRMTPAGLEIAQYLIPDYSDEAAMLEALLPHLTDTTLVTYNGAAFDLPILRDRFIINRVERNLAFDGNIDLLQSTRRLFRRRIKDCSLGNVEKEIFGLSRTDDVPGYLVPSIYFDWLSSERTDQLPGVLEHNLLDIVSLHFLAVHIARSFRSEGESLKAVDDVYSLSRVYHRRNDRHRVRKLCDRIDAETGGSLPNDIRLFQAFAFKRAGEWDSAVDIFQRLALLDGRESYWANLELAKYFEHQAGDIPRAIHHAQRAFSSSPCSRTEKEHLTHRLTRLQAKTGV